MTITMRVHATSDIALVIVITLPSQGWAPVSLESLPLLKRWTGIQGRDPEERPVHRLSTQ